MKLISDDTDTVPRDDLLVRKLLDDKMCHFTAGTAGEEHPERRCVVARERKE